MAGALRRRGCCAAPCCALWLLAAAAALVQLREATLPALLFQPRPPSPLVRSLRDYGLAVLPAREGDAAAARADDPRLVPLDATVYWQATLLPAAAPAPVPAPAPAAELVVLYWHGNGENWLDASRALRALHGAAWAGADAEVALVAVEYPGYGAHDHGRDRLSLRAACAAAERVADHFLEACPRARLVVAGFSLGAAVAAHAAAHVAARPDGAARLAGVVLAAPFESLARAVGEHAARLAMRLARAGGLPRGLAEALAPPAARALGLLAAHGTLDTRASLAALFARAPRAPLLLVHGALDDVTPAAHSEALARAFSASHDVTLRLEPHQAHNDLAWQAPAAAWCTRLVAAPAAVPAAVPAISS